MELHSHFEECFKKQQETYLQYLLSLLARTTEHSLNPYDNIVKLINQIALQSKIDQSIEEFFREINVEKKAWLELGTSNEKVTLILKCLEKSVEEGSRKINSSTFAPPQTYKIKGKQNQKSSNFTWLSIKSKHPMLENKLKAKVIQAITDSKNEQRLRQSIGKPGNVSLLDEECTLEEYDKAKIEYEWSDEDEKILLEGVKALKTKFTRTEFLKKCERLRFVSQHEFETLASQQISRKLDKNNKIFLSREFLLDKFYSTTDYLTEQQMRFILKTSPLLSKCVDKAFIKASLRVVPYEDISRLELQLAEDIISRFEQIRTSVRESRKTYKQARNSEIKTRIEKFERKVLLKGIRQADNENLKKHKMQRSGTFFKKNSIVSKRREPVPLNKLHPPPGLFLKECNEHCNDDLFNVYEQSYLDQANKQVIVAPKPTQISMINFYTGGPDETNFQPNQKIIQAYFYGKSVQQSLNSIEISMRNELSTVRTQKTKNMKQVKISEEDTEITIKKKLKENKDKIKTGIHIKKVLSYARDNQYANFLTLDSKFTPQQIDSVDDKGNTALFYTAMHENIEFTQNLLTLGANPCSVCEKESTPLHYIFKTSNISLISTCLCSHEVNLNLVNAEGKTPLAYCRRDVLVKLHLQEGVAVVKGTKIAFDNNSLLKKQKLENLQAAN